MSDATGGKSTRLLELALELSPAGMLAVDATGTILLVNREIERLFGYARDQLIGHSVDMLLPEPLREAHPEARDGYFRHPRSRPMGSGRDLYGQRSDGVRVPVEIGLNPVDTPEGPVVLASVVDITTRRQTEAQLRQAQKQEAIGTLASGIAHDFNNILLGITGYTELVLRSQGFTDPRARADLQSVLQAADRGRKLVERLLMFSRQSDVERAPIDPGPIVREAIALVRATLPSHVEIREILDPQAPSVMSHETLLHQIIMNLATNAAHAMPRGGVLEVQLSPYLAQGEDPRLPQGLYARLRVTDTGVGMTAEVLRRVTEPFYTTKPAGEGTGLGLSVIHGIVESHGGLVDIDSTPGAGTRVDVLLPAELPVQRSPAASHDTQKRVLLVEDESNLLAMLTRHLAAFGFHVSGHGSSVEALEVFKARPEGYDLLITDNSMPKMTGMELASRVHATRPQLPILLISGLPPGSDELAVHGVTHVIRKPCSMDSLESVLREIFSQDK